MNAPSDGSNRLDRQAGRSAFGSDAEGYHQARSGYPPALFEYLLGRTVAAPRVLEIGAGTGLASEGLLAGKPGRLSLVEPDPSLCSFLEARFGPAGVEIIPGGFLDAIIEGPFDLIACAAAFHWMEPEPALARIKALLEPGGIWAMWWNCYLGHGEDDPLAERAMDVLEEEQVALPPSFLPNGHYALDVDGQCDRLGSAGFTDIEHCLFRTPRELDPRQARELYASFSFIRILAAEARERILDRIENIVQIELGGTAASQVVTSLYSAAY